MSREILRWFRCALPNESVPFLLPKLGRLWVTIQAYLMEVRRWLIPHTFSGDEGENQ